MPPARLRPSHQQDRDENVHPSPRRPQGSLVQGRRSRTSACPAHGTQNTRRALGVREVPLGRHSPQLRGGRRLAAEHPHLQSWVKAQWEQRGPCLPWPGRGRDPAKARHRAPGPTVLPVCSRCEPDASFHLTTPDMAGCPPPLALKRTSRLGASETACGPLLSSGVTHKSRRQPPSPWDQPAQPPRVGS